ncbi:hypothetical protein ASD45_08585 [Pseudolabrys sp. Root1462]|nr:hypothetical protein ASD45_08585 [Pseudolabrys sp. Root1462]
MTLTDDHHNNIVFLGGSGVYAVTVGSITVPKWRCRVVNTSNSTGRCVVNGSDKRRLYPGMHVDLFCDGTTVYMGEVPKWLNLSPDLYVDPANGSDDPAVADGLDTGARAFATRQAAMAALYQEIEAGGSFPTIHLADGNYPGTLQLNANPSGATVIFWEGASALGAVFQGVTIIGDGAVHEVTNIKFASIQMHQFSVLDVLTGCGIGALTGSNSGISMDGAGATININNSFTVFGPMNYLFHAPSPGAINIAGNITITYSGTPTITALLRAIAGGVVTIGGTITHSGSIASGAQNWIVGPGGLISFGGTSASWPGTVAGSPALNAAPTGSTGWAV